MRQTLGEEGKAFDIEVNGIRLHGWSWGQFTTQDQAVFLLHGLSANSQSWADFGPALAARGWFAIAPDLRGRGQSEKPAHGYGVPYHANDILSLADSFKIDRLNLVGHSMGATISIFLAAIHPLRVGKVVLVDAGGNIPPDTAQAIGASLSRLGQSYPSVDNYLETMSKLPIYQWNAFWENYFRYDVEIMPDGTARSGVPKAAIEEEIRVMAATRLEALTDLIKAPTLIVRATVGMLGPDKGLVLPREEAERLQRVIVGSRVVEIPQANHYTVALSDVFKKEVLEFLG